MSIIFQNFGEKYFEVMNPTTMNPNLMVNNTFVKLQIKVQTPDTLNFKRG